MPYAWTQEVPINMDMYQQIRAELGDELPLGLIVHVVSTTDRGLRYLDVWESEADCNRFTGQRLHPAIGRVFARAHFQPPAEEPPREMVDVREVWLAPGMLISD